MAYSKAWIYLRDVGPDMKHMVAVSLWACPYCQKTHATYVGHEPMMPFCWECGHPIMLKQSLQAPASGPVEKQRRKAKAKGSGLAVVRNTSMDMIRFDDLARRK